MGELFGCLAEGFLELFFELLLEFITGAIYSGIIIFYPKAKRESKALRIISIILSLLMLLGQVIGICLVVQESGTARIVGILMTAIPCVFFVIGLVVSVVREKRKNKNDNAPSDETNQRDET
ncbi:MAG: hypothetical protein J5850_01150 [Clostridia bacterium]|nr:hypothetical protein [Clostridia bacterium]